MPTVLAFNSVLTPLSSSTVRSRPYYPHRRTYRRSSIDFGLASLLRSSRLLSHRLRHPRQSLRTGSAGIPLRPRTLFKVLLELWKSIERTASSMRNVSSG